jgi:hypothetical protein
MTNIESSNELKSTLSELYSLGDEANTTEHILPIISALRDITGLHFSIGTLVPTKDNAESIICEFMSTVEPSKLSQLSNICILRTLFQFNSKKQWQSLKDRVHSHFKESKIEISRSTEQLFKT